MDYEEDFYVAGHKVYIYEDDSHDKYGPCLTEKWEKDGHLHSLYDRPAVIMSSKDGRALVQQWYHKGMLHRDVGPAVVETDNWSRREEWYKHGVCTKLDGPALLEVCSDGLIAEERWMIDGKEHRVDGPSYVSRDYETHVTLIEQWMQHGNFCRSNGPVFIERGSDGEILSMEWPDHTYQSNWTKLDI